MRPVYEITCGSVFVTSDTQKRAAIRYARMRCGLYRRSGKRWSVYQNGGFTGGRRRRLIYQVHWSARERRLVAEEL